MSVISKLITLGAAGGGGAANWALEFTNSGTLLGGQASADAVFFASSVSGNGFVFSVDYAGSINWHKELSGSYLPQSAALLSNEFHVLCLDASQSYRQIILSLSTASGAIARNSHSNPSSAGTNPTAETISADGSKVLTVQERSSTVEYRMFETSGLSGYSNSWSKSVSSASEAGIWAYPSYAYLTYKNTSTYISYLSKRSISNGSFSWAYYYLPSGYVATTIHDISFLSGGDMIVVGDIVLDNTYRNDNFIARIDANGTVQWFKYNVLDYPQSYQDVVVDTATDEIYTLQTYSGSNYNDLNKFDASGNLIWEKRFSDFYNNPRTNYLATSSGAGCVFAGMKDENSTRNTVFKISSDGVSDGTYGGITISTPSKTFTSISPTRYSVGDQLSTITSGVSSTAVTTSDATQGSSTLIPL